MPVAGRSSATLLAVLALSPGVVVSAKRLIEDLWPTAMPQQP